MKRTQYLAAAAALHDQIATLERYFDFGSDNPREQQQIDSSYLQQLDARLSSPPSKALTDASRVNLGTFDGAVAASHGLLSSLDRKARGARKLIREITRWALEKGASDAGVTDGNYPQQQGNPSLSSLDDVESALNDLRSSSGMVSVCFVAGCALPTAVR